jgi:hypothetical protein
MVIQWVQARPHLQLASWSLGHPRLKLQGRGVQLPAGQRTCSRLLMSRDRPLEFTFFFYQPETVHRLRQTLRINFSAFTDHTTHISHTTSVEEWREDDSDKGLAEK